MSTLSTLPSLVQLDPPDVGTGAWYTIPGNIQNHYDNLTQTISVNEKDKSGLPAWLTFSSNTNTLKAEPRSNNHNDITLTISAGSDTKEVTLRTRKMKRFTKTTESFLQAGVHKMADGTTIAFANHASNDTLIATITPTSGPVVTATLTTALSAGEVACTALSNTTIAVAWIGSNGTNLATVNVTTGVQNQITSILTGFANGSVGVAPISSALFALTGITTGASANIKYFIVDATSNPPTPGEVTNTSVVVTNFKTFRLPGGNLLALWSTASNDVVGKLHTGPAAGAFDMSGSTVTIGKGPIQLDGSGVGVFPNGDIIRTWIDANSVKARLYNSSLTAKGTTDISVGDSTSAPSLLQVGVLSDQKAFIAWKGSGGKLFGRLYHSDGFALSYQREITSQVLTSYNLEEVIPVGALKAIRIAWELTGTASAVYLEPNLANPFGNHFYPSLVSEFLDEKVREGETFPLNFSQKFKNYNTTPLTYEVTSYPHKSSLTSSPSQNTSVSFTPYDAGKFVMEVEASTDQGLSIKTSFYLTVCESECSEATPLLDPEIVRGPVIEVRSSVWGAWAIGIVGVLVVAGIAVPLILLVK